MVRYRQDIDKEGSSGLDTTKNEPYVMILKVSNHTAVENKDIPQDIAKEALPGPCVGGEAACGLESLKRDVAEAGQVGIEPAAEAVVRLV